MAVTTCFIHLPQRHEAGMSQESVTLVPMRNLPALLLRGGSVCRGTVSMLTGWLLVSC